MTLFEAIKTVSCGEAAARLGLKGKRTGPTRSVYCCPWHLDRTPSLVCFDEQNRFYCFSCHKHGDAADLYSAVLGLGMYDAARRVCEDFALRWEQPSRNRPQAIALPTAISAEAGTIVSLCRVWKQIQLRMAREEIEAATERLSQLQTPSAPGWNANLAQAVRFQDEYNRVDAMTLGDVLETIKEDFTLERKEEIDAESAH